MSEVETVELVGFVKWAKLKKAQPNYNQDLEYGLDFSITDEQYKDLMSKGLDKRTKLRPDTETNLSYIKLKQPAFSQDGEALSKPVVVDSEGNNYAGLIGNGSKARVRVALIPNKKLGGVFARLVGVQVLDLVEYQGGGVATFSADTSGTFKAEPVNVDEGDVFKGAV